MITIDAKKYGLLLLNAILEQDDLPMDIQAGIYNALILIDPQPEEDALFYDALKYAGEVTHHANTELEALLSEYGKQLKNEGE